MQDRLFDTMPELGQTQHFHYDPGKDTFTIETRQDAEPILEANKVQFNATERRTPWTDGMAKVATIPLTVLSNLAQQGIVTPGGVVLDRKRLFAFLNDPENRAFRTRAGRL